jgi:hypothetical protein
MAIKKSFFSAKVVVGIVVTLFFVLSFVPKLVLEFVEKGLPYFRDIGHSFVNWYDDPTAFVLSYFVGYILLWWKPLPGSVLIILACLLSVSFNLDNMGFLIFALPALAVAVLYLSDLKKPGKAGKVVS